MVSASKSNPYHLRPMTEISFGFPLLPQTDREGTGDRLNPRKEWSPGGISLRMISEKQRREVLARPGPRGEPAGLPRGTGPLDPDPRLAGERETARPVLSREIALPGSQKIL